MDFPLDTLSCENYHSLNTTIALSDSRLRYVQMHGLQPSAIQRFLKIFKLVCKENIVKKQNSQEDS